MGGKNSSVTDTPPWGPLHTGGSPSQAQETGTVVVSYPFQSPHYGNIRVPLGREVTVMYRPLQCRKDANLLFLSFSLFLFCDSFRWLHNNRYGFLIPPLPLPLFLSERVISCVLTPFFSLYFLFICLFDCYLMEGNFWTVRKDCQIPWQPTQIADIYITHWAARANITLSNRECRVLLTHVTSRVCGACTTGRVGGMTALVWGMLHLVEGQSYSPLPWGRQPKVGPPLHWLHLRTACPMWLLSEADASPYHSVYCGPSGQLLGIYTGWPLVGCCT